MKSDPYLQRRQCDCQQRSPEVDSALGLEPTGSDDTDTESILLVLDYESEGSANAATGAAAAADPLTTTLTQPLSQIFNNRYDHDDYDENHAGGSEGDELDGDDDGGDEGDESVNLVRFGSTFALEDCFMIEGWTLSTTIANNTYATPK